MSNNKSEPLMFIQTISNNVQLSSNQMYFDSRYKSQNKVKVEVSPSKREETTPINTFNNELFKKVKMITSASNLGMKITCEVVLVSGESLYGSISHYDDNSFLFDGNVIKYLDTYEINIQTIK